MIARSRAEGVAEGVPHAVIRVLVERGLDATPEQRARILAERDPAQLSRWLARAITVATAAELLGTP